MPEKTFEILIDRLIDLAYETGYISAQFEAGVYREGSIHRQNAEDKQAKLIKERNDKRDELIEYEISLRWLGG